MGRYIATCIDKGVAFEELLSRERAEALKLFKRHQPRMDITSVDLRLWQKDLMDILKEEFDGRKVFWINGNRGDEGKSWMQCYIESYYGRVRVARLELRNTTSNTLHALSKQPLQTMDIFLFNDTRSSMHPINYSVLELLKDGSAVSVKYNSHIVNFKVPNIVIVFSNHMPNTSKLSEDRWRIYSINKQGLAFKDAIHVREHSVYHYNGNIS